jgi:Domain of unknown function (DUF4314)
VQFSTYNSGVETLGTKKTVKVGDRVKLTEMNDTWSRLEKGSEGTVSKIEEDQDLIWVKWDNGEKLALLDGIDKFKVVKD